MTAQASVGMGEEGTLTFHLWGTWHRLDTSSADSIAAAAQTLVKYALATQPRDQPRRNQTEPGFDSSAGQQSAGNPELGGCAAAGSRAADFQAHLAQQLRKVADTNSLADTRLLMVQVGLLPSVPLPVSLTVYSADRFQMSPAIGTSSDAVLGVLERGLLAVNKPAPKSICRRPFTGGETVRAHQVDKESAQLLAQYWYPVPGTKRVILVVMGTPLVSIANVMLTYFDSIVAASSFTGVEPRILRTR